VARAFAVNTVEAIAAHNAQKAVADPFARIVASHRHPSPRVNDCSRPKRCCQRTFLMNSAKTSVSLEDEFWTALKKIAHERRETLQHLINSIHRNRRNANLSSTIRLFILKFYKDELARQQAMFEQWEILVRGRKKRRARILGRA
jgi:predicted DNA-binding ribbon-helix-helix protein